MGSFIGNLVTKKKRKKLNKAIASESQEQMNLALETAELEEKANDVMMTRANVEMKQDRISAVREARIRRAQMIQGATNAGAIGGSTVNTAAGAIMTQLMSGVGLQNIFAGFSEQLSEINTDIGEKQSDIIRSQGKQAEYGAKLQTQQEKANLIGGAVDLGLAVAGAFISPASAASGFQNVGRGAMDYAANYFKAPTRAVSSSSSFSNSVRSTSSIFGPAKKGY